MTKTSEELFSGEDMLGGIERREVGGQVELLLHGRPVLAYRSDDPVARDFVIATLLRDGLRGKTVATLCAMSEPHVTRVKQRDAAGGFEALAVRGKGGNPRALTGRQLTKLKKMNAERVPMIHIAAELDVSPSTIRKTLDRLGIRPSRAHGSQEVLPGVGGAPSASPVPPKAATQEPKPEAAEVSEDDELAPGAALPAGPAEHPTRYAGTLLLAAALAKLGVPEALDEANAKRKDTAVYDAHQMLTALACGWVSGHGSLESMHERDARGLGVVLGLERSPSVRTAHRAIGEMVARFDPIRLGLALMNGLRKAGREQPQLFGIDGHFKEYTGPAPIDKGWNPHKRMATKGLGQVMVHDTGGATWLTLPTGAGDALSQHVVTAARQLRKVHGPEAPLILGFDRGGFCFETLRTLHAEGFGYLAWVPASANTPPLASVAPQSDGVGATRWEHPDLDHRARLLVQRDGEALLPAVTNLSDDIEPAEALRMLRLVRGVEENAIKAARASTHIDRLVDRGTEREAPDDRLVPNRERKELRARKKALVARIAVMEEQQPLTADGLISAPRLLAELEEAVVDATLRTTPAKLPRVALEPEARRAWLQTKNRGLLLPLKLATDNARRWLFAKLGDALAPTDHDYDASAMPRTLMALLRAPGSVRFGDDGVDVTLDLPLPHTAHARIDDALKALSGLTFPDDRRQRHPRPVRFRLAPRPSRASLPHHAENSQD